MRHIDRMENPTAPVGAYVYRIYNTGLSSQRFGNCEICGGNCTEVFHQVEGKIFEPGKMTYYECRDLWGHEKCLKGARR